MPDTEGKKVATHLRFQAVLDPAGLFHFSTQVSILPGLTVSSCTHRLNPTLTPGRGDKIPLDHDMDITNTGFLQTKKEK